MHHSAGHAGSLGRNKCVRWCFRCRGRRCSCRINAPTLSPARDKFASGSVRAAFAGPTFTSWTASFPISAIRSCRATRSSAALKRSDPAYRGFAIGDRVGIPWLGSTCGACRLLPRRPARTSATFAVYRLHPRRRLRRRAPCRCPLRLPSVPRLRRPRRAAALRRADRLPHRCAWPARPASRHLRLWRRGAYRGAGRARRAEVYAFTRPGDFAAQHFRGGLGADWAGGSDETPAIRSTRRSSSRRSAGWSQRRSRHAQGRHRRLRRHSHERHTGVSYACSGENAGSVANLTREDGRDFLRSSPQGGDPDPDDRVPACRRPTRSRPNRGPDKSWARPSSDPEIAERMTASTENRRSAGRRPSSHS